LLKSVNPEAYLIGEIWWEAWPDRLMDPVPYMQGDIFDAVMYYHIYKPARYFFADTDLKLNADQLKDSLQLLWGKLDKTNAVLNDEYSSNPRLPSPAIVI